MKKFLLLAFIICIVPANAQKIFNKPQFGFSMQEPANWIAADKSALVNNLEKFKIDNPGLKKLISENNGTLLLGAFYKYNPKTKAGVIPTIQINLRDKGKANFAQFKNSIIASAKTFKSTFPDFEFIQQPHEVTISGIKSICFIGKFTMKSENGTVLKVRSRTYAIPYKDYFFQVNFTDAQTGEDCSKEFDALVKTIKIG